MSLHLAKPEHEVAYHELNNLLRKHADKISSLEMLAIAANMLGKIVALQDQRTVTPSMAMEIVSRNIEHGNKQVLDRLATEVNGSWRHIMNNPPLLILNAGRGTTPPCPEAIFKKGDVVKVSRAKATAHFPHEMVVAGIVPPRFPAEYALADLLDEPRPLMISKEKRAVQYILVADGNPTPFVCTAKHLRATGATVEIGSIKRASP